MSRVESYYFCSSCQKQWMVASTIQSGIQSCPMCTKRYNPYSVVSDNCEFIFRIESHTFDQKTIGIIINWSMFTLSFISKMPLVRPYFMNRNIAVRTVVTSGATELVNQMSLTNANNAMFLLSHTHRYSHLTQIKWYIFWSHSRCQSWLWENGHLVIWMIHFRWFHADDLTGTLERCGRYLANYTEIHSLTLILWTGWV